jgi:hypothetical protein
MDMKRKSWGQLLKVFSMASGPLLRLAEEPGPLVAAPQRVLALF